ncbi:acetyl-CoA acetyltransferase [Arthrobacter sp. UYEF6]
MLHRSRWPDYGLPFSPGWDGDGSNASPLTDGAAAVVLTTRETAHTHGWNVLAVLRSHGQIAGTDTSLPDKPAKAILAALSREGWTADELDLIEINEAFASVTLHSGNSLGVSEDR